jgi:fumarate hydratase class II
MLVTALSPVVGYDKASKIAYKALEEETTLKKAALSTGLIDEKTFDDAVDPQKMAFPNG